MLSEGFRDRKAERERARIAFAQKFPVGTTVEFSTLPDQILNIPLKFRPYPPGTQFIVEKITPDGYLRLSEKGCDNTIGGGRVSPNNQALIRIAQKE